MSNYLKNFASDKLSEINRFAKKELSEVFERFFESFPEVGAICWHHRSEVYNDSGYDNVISAPDIFPNENVCSEELIHLFNEKLDNYRSKKEEEYPYLCEESLDIFEEINSKLKSEELDNLILSAKEMCEHKTGIFSQLNKEFLQFLFGLDCDVRVKNNFGRVEITLYKDDLKNYY